MVLGIAEREMARKAMRCWREPRTTVITLAFFHCAAHEDRAEEALCMLVIRRDKVSESLAGRAHHASAGPASESPFNHDHSPQKLFADYFSVSLVIFLFIESSHFSQVPKFAALFRQ